MRGTRAGISQLGRLARRVITSKDNPKLKLVRALQRKKEREETGLFACEGEDLCDAALAAGSSPSSCWSPGETVDAASCSPGVSTLPHPPRAIGVFRRDDLPVGMPRDVPRTLAALRPGQRRHADPLGGRVRRSRLALRGLRRPALAEGASRERRCDLPRPARPVGRSRRPSGRARRGRRRVARRYRPRASGHDRARCRTGGAARRAPGGVRRVASIPMPGAAESLNVAAAGAIALYELSRRSS